MKITDKRIRIFIAGGVMVTCLVLVAQGHDSWIQATGLLSAGFLFGNSAK